MENIINYYWIQKSDYSSDYYNIDSVDDAIQSFNTYNWKNELAKYNENDKKNNCPPGFGLHDGNEDGSLFSKLIHICPIDEKYVFFNLHYPKENKLFGFIKFESQEIYYKDKLSSNDVSQLINLFYKSEYNKILEL